MNDGATHLVREGTCDQCHTGMWSVDGSPPECLCDVTPPPEVLDAEWRWLSGGGDLSSDELDRVHYLPGGGTMTAREAYRDLADGFACDHSLGFYALASPRPVRVGSCPACGRESDGDLCDRCADDDARTFGLVPLRRTAFGPPPPPKDDAA